MSTPRRVLIVTEDPVGAAMGGAAIRAYEMARALATTASVTLAAPGSPPPDLGEVTHVALAPNRPRVLASLLASADAIVLRPPNPALAAVVARSGVRVILDLCDPLTLDTLEARAGASSWSQQFWSTLTLDHLLDALHRGHHFICAGERQRDLYLGALLAARLITPASYRADPSFRTFIDSVPLGIPSESPQRIPGVGPRAQIPSLAGDVRLLLWNGGIWNWLDPVTAVAAAARAHAHDRRVRLVFMFGGALDGDERREARAARALAAHLGLLGTVVIFHEPVIDYRERASWLLDADCLLSTHRDHLESTFSFRTRLLDCFWTGTPAVCTAGGELSAMIADSDGGRVVPAGDADALAAAITEVLGRGRDAYRDRLRQRGEQLTWTEVVAPLRRMIANDEPPQALGDHLAMRLSDPARRARSAVARLVSSTRR